MAADYTDTIAFIELPSRLAVPEMTTLPISSWEPGYTWPETPSLSEVGTIGGNGGGGGSTRPTTGFLYPRGNT